MIRKRIIFCSFLFFFFTIHSAQSQLSIDHSKWDHLLKNYVHDGLVDYQALAQNRSELDDYLKQLESYSLESFADFSREDRIAFWINLYNASVIRIVLDGFPVIRLDQIPAVYEIRTIRAVGEYFSLSDLLNEVLRKGFRDERILTALVSGRKDSPRLLGEAFDGKRIEEQLDRAAYQFVSDNAQNQIKPGSKKIYLSPLFKKFGSDFLLNYSSNNDSRYSQVESAVIGFILHHLKDPEKRIFLDSARYKIEYLPEDPRLNAVQ